MKTFFVSYSSADREFVTPLVQLLRVAAPAFLDRDCIPLGRRWREVITEAIGAATDVLLFWCAHSRTSKEVAWEVRQALALEKPLIPVLLDDAALPPKLARYQSLAMRQFGSHAATRSIVPIRPAAAEVQQFHAELAQLLGAPIEALRAG